MPLLVSTTDKVTDTQPITTQMAKDQKQFATLPANYSKGVVTFAFELDEDDIKDVLENKKIYVLLQTGGPYMVPINVGVDPVTFDEATEYAREQMVPSEGNES